MLTVGLTGQSGAGKGVFSKAVLQIEGVYVLDTDLVARQVVEKGEKCLDELCRCFSCDILNPDGTLNRQKLASMAFTDEEKHSELNRITHFYIMEKTRAWLNECKKKNAVCAIIDAPLLFESKADSLCDVTVGIIAPYDIRLCRIIERDGIDEKNARIRLDSQPDDGFFREKCNYILENTTTEESFAQTVYQFLTEIINSKGVKGNIL